MKATSSDWDWTGRIRAMDAAAKAAGIGKGKGKGKGKSKGKAVEIEMATLASMPWRLFAAEVLLCEKDVTEDDFWLRMRRDAATMDAAQTELDAWRDFGKGPPVATRTHRRKVLPKVQPTKSPTNSQTKSPTNSPTKSLTKSPINGHNSPAKSLDWQLKSLTAVW